MNLLDAFKNSPKTLTAEQFRAALNAAGLNQYTYNKLTGHSLSQTHNHAKGTVPPKKIHVVLLCLLCGGPESRTWRDVLAAGRKRDSKTETRAAA